MFGRDPGNDTRTVNPMLEGTPTDTPLRTPEPVGTTQEVRGTPVTISRVAAQDALIHAAGPNELGFAYDPGTRYLLAAVRGGEGITRSTFRLRTEDTTVSAAPGMPTAIRWLPAAGWVPAYDSERPSGYVGFVIPAPLETSEAVITVGQAGWRLSSETRATLARPEPSFELVEFTAPDRVEEDEPFRLRLGVRNVGERPATFRAVVTAAREPRRDFSTWLRLSVDQGQTGRWTREFDPVWTDRRWSRIAFTISSVLGEFTTVVRSTRSTSEE